MKDEVRSKKEDAIAYAGTESRKQQYPDSGPDPISTSGSGEMK
jgi:hypothetical protein